MPKIDPYTAKRRLPVNDSVVLTDGIKDFAKAKRHIVIMLIETKEHM